MPRTKFLRSPPVRLPSGLLIPLSQDGRQVLRPALDAAGLELAKDTDLLDTPPTAVDIEQAIRSAHRRGLAAVGLMYAPGEPGVNLSHRQRRTETDFDIVVRFDGETTFELGPSGPDATGRSDTLAVVGDIHGCAETFLNGLLPAVGTDANLSNPNLTVVSVGDINDKGTRSVDVIRWWLWALTTGRALLVNSNHNRALVRALSGSGYVPRDATRRTVSEIDAQPDACELRAAIVAAFSRLPSHLVFPGHVIAHAAMTEKHLFRTGKDVESFALYARNDDTPWEWSGERTLIHGHVVVPRPSTRRAAARPGRKPGPVIDIDTGASLGGGLTAYMSEAGATVTVSSAAADLAEGASASDRAA